MTDPKADKAPPVEDGAIRLKEQVKGYIEAEVKQGYGLNQVVGFLKEKGYTSATVEIAAAEVAREHGLSKRAITKEVPEKHHVKRRWMMPVFLVFVLIAAVIGGFYFYTELPEEVGETQDGTLAYAQLGISSLKYEAKQVKTVMERTETIEVAKANAIINQRRGNEYFKDIRYDPDVVDGVVKKVMAFEVLNKETNGLEVLTKIIIKAVPKKDVSRLKIIEIIPKPIAESADEILLPQGGVVVEKDPILQWSFTDVKAGQEVESSYVIKKRVTSTSTTTIPVVAGIAYIGKKTVCGDAQCEKGENYINCCTDCGCTPGFLCEEGKCAKQDSAPPLIEEQNGTEVVASTMQDAPVGSSPEIKKVWATPANVKHHEEVVIEVDVSDEDNDINEVWLEVRELLDSHQETSPMFDDGNAIDLYPQYEEFYGSGDLTASDGVYTMTVYVSDYYLKGTYNVDVHTKDTGGNSVSSSTVFTVS